MAATFISSACSQRNRTFNGSWNCTKNGDPTANQSERLPEDVTPTRKERLACTQAYNESEEVGSRIPFLGLRLVQAGEPKAQRCPLYPFTIWLGFHSQVSDA
jgi:hypothetical protein